MRKKLISLLLVWAMAMPLMIWTAMPVSAEEFALDPSQLLTPSDLAALDKTGGTLEGKAYSVECNSEGKTAAIRYDKLGMGPSYAAENRYLLVDIYYKKASNTTTLYGMNVLFRSNGTDTDDWTHIYQQADSVKKPSSDSSYLPNRWETVVIDCQAAMEYLSANGLTQKQLQITIPATTGSDRVYLGEIRFSATAGSSGTVDENYLNVLKTANNGNQADLVKILLNDTGFSPEYAALSDKGLYLDEIEDGTVAADTFAEDLIAKKPEGDGFTEDNFVALFNETVAETVFGAADADGKVSVIENPRYSTALGTASIVSSKAYAILDEKGLKNTVFEGVGDSGFADQLRENVIVAAFNTAEDEITMQEIAEESREAIPITLTADYTAFSDDQKEALYGSMLQTKPYADYADIAQKFDAAYNEVKNAPVSYTFTLRRNKIMTASDLPTYTETDFGGKKNVMQFENTNEVTTKGIRYGGLNMGTEYSSANKTLLVDCYLNDEGASTFSLSVVFRHIANVDKWINGEPTSTRSSGSYPANSWVTVAVDCQVPLQYLVSNGYTLDQLQIAIPGTDGSFYVGNVRFTDDEIPYEATKTYTLDRSKIVPPSDDNPDLPSYETVDYGGKSGVMSFRNIRTVETQAIRYDGLNVNQTSVGASGYLFVDCYLEDSERDEFGLTVTFRQTTGGKWISNEAVATKASPAYPANRWVTVAIDCSEPLEYLEINGYSLKQLQIGLPNVQGTLYVGDVRFVGFAEDASVDLYEDDAPCEWKNGDLKVKVTFSDQFTSRQMTVYAVKYEASDQKLAVKELQTVNRLVHPGETVELPITVSDASRSFMKVLIVDGRNKPISDAKVFGTVPAEEIEVKSDTDKTFYLNETEYEGQNVRITGEENKSPYAAITVIVKKDDEVLFADQKNVNENGGFAFDFSAERSFAADGTAKTPAGVYTAYVSSDFSDEILEESIGIADEDALTAALQVINAGAKSDIISLLTGDQDDVSSFLSYISLAANGLYMEEITENSMQTAVADLLISRKPEGGYTAENIITVGNQAVAEILYASADTDQKYDMLKNERYSRVFGTASVGEKTYEMLEGNRSKGTIFEGLSPSDSDFAEKLTENMILLALDSAQNSTQVKDIIEENYKVIPITFEKNYTSLRSDQLKILYDKMLSGKPFSDYEDVKNKFQAAYTVAKKASPTASPSSSSGGSGGSGSPAVPVTRGESGADSGKKSKFSDVWNLTWGKDEIIALTERGIINGMSESVFAPDDPITREQFCKLIAAAYEIRGTSELPFKDVDSGAWYEAPIKALYANQVIQGISADLFGVGNKITRQDAAVILYNVLKNKLPKGDTEKSFYDADSISDYAKTAVSVLSSAGIINGYADNTFGPRKEITRREAAVIIYRTLELDR